MSKTRTHRMRVATDTATLAVFDPVRLRHRLSGPHDWWTWAPTCAEEMNAGNLLAVDLGADGVYEVVIHLEIDRPESDTRVAGLVACDSGKLYIGPGKQITADGLEPDDSHGGIHLPAPTGTYHARFARDEELVEVWLEPVNTLARNHFSDYLRL